MKPYRGTLLALALLLTLPPLSGCGDADKYKQTGGIDLTAILGSIAVNESVGFTVTATFPEATGATGATPINACTVTLEYLAQGGGLDQNWQQVPGTGTTRAFTLSPHEAGTLVVIARGKCIGSTEDWKYSGKATVTVGEITGPLTGISLAANPSSVVYDTPVTFTLTATRTEPCTLRLKYQYSGAGADPPGAVGPIPDGDVRTVNPASVGQFILTPTEIGTLVVTATGWCSQSPKAEVSTTVTVVSTDVVLPTVTSVTLTSPTVSPLTHPATIDYTLSAIKSTGCTLILKRVHSGTALTALTVNPTNAGDYSVNTIAPSPSPGTAVINASGWCSENPSAIVSATKLEFTVN